MKTICMLAFILFTSFSGSIPNKTVERVDLQRFGGKWYSLYSIPTFFDKDTRETTALYTLNKDGYYDVMTYAKKGDDEQIHTYKSKLFPVEGSHNAYLKAQFIWPIKVDYWVIELAADYSYVVVGHPDHRFLFIMTRKPSLDKKLLDEIIARCKAKGYATEKLTSQKHNG